jgi:hypothetical protein
MESSAGMPLCTYRHGGVVHKPHPSKCLGAIFSKIQQEIKLDLGANGGHAQGRGGRGRKQDRSSSAIRLHSRNNQFRHPHRVGGYMGNRGRVFCYR